MVSTALRPLPVLHRVYERHGRRLPGLAELLLSILLAHAAGTLIWTLLPSSADADWQAPTAGAAAVTAGPGAQGPQVELITAAHLFGVYQVSADPALSELSNAPDTRLDLTLLGILAATADRGSRALIGSSGGEEKPYAIGDNVVRGVSLQAIFPDRVILSRAGQLETLRLDKNAPSRPGPANPAPAAAPATGAAADTSELLSTVRQQLMSDPSRAADYIRIQPASNGGQLRGYRVYPGRDRKVFSAVGLRPGDLITQVNGIQLNDANMALQVLGQLSQASSATVVIERGGQQQTVNVNFN